MKIETVKKNLNSLYKDIPENKQKLARSLIDNVAWMIIQLGELRSQIDQYGLVYDYQNGRQQCRAESPYSKAYNSMFPKFLNAIKQLNDMLPDDVDKKESDPLLDFINGDSDE